MKTKVFLTGLLIVIFLACKTEEEKKAEETVDTYTVYTDSISNVSAADAKANWEAIDAEYMQRTADAEAALANYQDKAQAEERINASKSKYMEMKAKYLEELNMENGSSDTYSYTPSLAALQSLGKALSLDTPNTIRKNNSVSIDDVIPLTRPELESMKSTTTIFTGDKSAGITVPGFGPLKLAKGESNVNAYYLEKKKVRTAKGEAVYGIGYCVHYLFKKVKKGLTVNNLANISASVQLDNNKTEVYYSIQSYGMTGLPLVKFFKPVIYKNFDVEGFAVIQSSIDGIQNILGDATLSGQLSFKPEIIPWYKE